MARFARTATDRVGPAEPVLVLVFVLAITQVSHLLRIFLAPGNSFRLPGLGAGLSSKWAVRGALVVIICLGETLLVSGAPFSKMAWGWPGMLAFLAPVAGSVGMWRVDVHIGLRRGTHQIEHAENAGAIAPLSSTCLHVPLVVGVALTSMGAKRAVGIGGVALWEHRSIGTITA
jgi:low temperature requirement protein LtrA